MTTDTHTTAPGLQTGSRPNIPDEPVCPYCLSNADDHLVFCEECGAPHHHDCWAESEGCAILGCKAASVSEPDTEGADAVPVHSVATDAHEWPLASPSTYLPTRQPLVELEPEGSERAASGDASQVADARPLPAVAPGPTVQMPYEAFATTGVPQEPKTTARSSGRRTVIAILMTAVITGAAAAAIAVPIIDSAEAKAASEAFDAGHDDGYSSGRNAGYDEGYRDGGQLAYDRGVTDGYEDGHDDGYSAGHDEGYWEGYEEGLWDSY